MCRHVAYLGPETGLSALLLDPPHGLVEQAAAPKLQTSTPTNPDGWGVAWYGDQDVAPQHHRTAVPIWDDTRFVADHKGASGHAVVAAVRAASPGSHIDARNNAPFVAGQWMFSLNGFVAGFRDDVGAALRGALSSVRRASLEGDSDSEVLLALVLERMERGDRPDAAVASVAASVQERAGGRLNLLLADRDHIVATALGNSLFVRSRAGATTVASEPLDRRGTWEPVPDGSLVTATAGSHELRPLGTS